MKSITTSIIVAIVLIGGTFLFSRNGGVNGGRDVISNVPANNVSVVDGKQIIEISAKGGYQPRKSTAKLGIPTVLRFNTNGTFDCSSVVRIPSMNISKILPQSGATDIDLGSPMAGLLKGSCGMGMYPFEIDFQG